MTEKQAYEILTNTPIRSQHNHVEYSKALHIAIGALGRQIPKKPDFFMGLRKCPNCKDFVININKYCPKCGQALLWEDDIE